MREIKFRAWHAGDWANKPQMLFDEKPGDCLVWKNQGQNITDVMQFTGLHDKNGKEIYEGDIVTEHHGGLAFECDFFQTQEVKWDTFGYIPFQRVIGGTMHDYANNLKEYIVIGNIYEHPELLEVTP